MRVLTKTNRTIKISPHAIQRFNERVSLDPYRKEIIRRAWDTGIDLNDRERERIFKKGVYITPKYWDSYYKKYHGHTFVFRLDGAAIVLVTIL